MADDFEASANARRVFLALGKLGGEATVGAITAEVVQDGGRIPDRPEKMVSRALRELAREGYVIAL
jgi:hypothetical protein